MKVHNSQTLPLFHPRLLSFFFAVSQRIIETSDLSGVLESILIQATRFLKSESSTLHLVNKENGLFELRKKYNLEDGCEKILDGTQALIQAAIGDRKIRILSDISKDPHFQPEDNPIRERFSSAICSPLLVKGKVMGVLTLFSRKRRRYGTKDTALIRAFADFTVLTVRNANVIKRLKGSGERPTDASRKKITEKKRMEAEHSRRWTELDKRNRELSTLNERLKESEQKYRTFIESIEDPCFEVDIAGNFTFVNETLCRIFGYSRDELMGMNNRAYMDEENAGKVYQAFNMINATGEPCKDLLYEVKTRDGGTRYIETYASLIYDHNGEKIGFRGVARDITAHRHILMRAARAEESYKKLFETVSDAILLVNREGFITTFNQMFIKMSGYAEEEIKKLHLSNIIHPDDFSLAAGEFLKAMQGEKAMERHTFRIINKEGGTIHVEGHFRRMMEAERITGTLGVLRDITEKMAMEKELEELSITDGLTGLYNQRYFYRALEKEMDRTRRQGTPLSLLLFDIDKFKTINDTYGHLEGDNILRMVAQITLKSIRKMDSAFRYGGDEFTVILPLAEKKEGGLVAERLRIACRQIPISQGISLSIGLAEFSPRQEFSSFIVCADTAMYSAKKMGGNRVFISPFLKG